MLWFKTNDKWKTTYKWRYLDLWLLIILIHVTTIHVYASTPWPRLGQPHKNFSTKPWLYPLNTHWTRYHNHLLANIWPLFKHPLPLHYRPLTFYDLIVQAFSDQIHCSCWLFFWNFYTLVICYERSSKCQYFSLILGGKMCILLIVWLNFESLTTIIL